MSGSLRPHGLQHARLPCPSPTLGTGSNSCPSSWWCHPTLSSFVIPYSSCLQAFPASGSFPRSQFFASGGQSIGVSASASVLPMTIQDWFPLGWTGWISLQSKGLSRVFSNTTVQKHQFLEGCAHFLLLELQNHNSLLNNHWEENVGSHQKKIPYVQEQRRSPSKMVGGAKLCLESNPIPTREAQRAQTKPCEHQVPETPQRPSQTCVWVFCGITGQQWPATGAGALGEADLVTQHVAQALLEDVAINPTTEPPSRRTKNCRTIIPKIFLHC